jgi:hypothetical protein
MMFSLMVKIEMAQAISGLSHCFVPKEGRHVSRVILFEI